MGGLWRLALAFKFFHGLGATNEVLQLFQKHLITSTSNLEQSGAVVLTAIGSKLLPHGNGLVKAHGYGNAPCVMFMEPGKGLKTAITCKGRWDIYDMPVCIIKRNDVGQLLQKSLAF